MAASDDDRQDELRHLVERRNVLVHRRRLLERRRDMQGEDTPTHVLAELDATAREIELVEAKIRLLDLDPRTLAAVGDNGIWAALSLRVERLERDMRKMFEGILEEIAADRDEARTYRSRQNDERVAGQRRILRAVIALVALELARTVLSILDAAHIAIAGWR